jgi:hypothetical protein
VGAYKILTGQAQTVHPILHEVYPEIPIFLLLRAFSSGCAALTGIEAISNGVRAFRDPVEKNAQITMTWMSVILGSLFLGITLVAHVYGIQPQHGVTAMSLLGRAIFNDSWLFYLVQFCTAMILFLAANTAYTGFPMLSSLLAKDRYLPRQLAIRGDKLVFSNGILGLSLAAALLVFIFNVDTHHLVPLYAVGVFLSFTLSQSGMVVHHWRCRSPGWIKGIIFNGLGALTTFVVLGVVGVTKFTNGAWMVVVTIPILVWVFKRIHAHYLQVGKELSLVGVEAPGNLNRLRHTVIVPISGIHRGVLDALRYAISISDDVRACYVELDPDTTERMREEWKKWAHEIPFVVLPSPYRSVIRPILDYVDDVEAITHNELITVIIPEFVTAKWHHRVLHNQTAWIIRAALSLKRNKVVTSVRYHLTTT